ncbi:hypothetical protein J6590_047344 [Homalodisca vitripennis]|nr:hypothetical protein J6590_047344 [Homalodisca vitripennis]
MFQVTLICLFTHERQGTIQTVMRRPEHQGQGWKVMFECSPDETRLCDPISVSRLRICSAVSAFAVVISGVGDNVGSFGLSDSSLSSPLYPRSQLAPLMEDSSETHGHLSSPLNPVGSSSQSGTATCMARLWTSTRLTFENETECF